MSTWWLLWCVIVQHGTKLLLNGVLCVNNKKEDWLSNANIRIFRWGNVMMSIFYSEIDFID